jgi:hypothetical protein
MLLELLGAALLLGCSSGKSSHETKKKTNYGFQEAESYTDRHGKEHVIDDEGYCEECDDYHDDY